MDEQTFNEPTVNEPAPSQPKKSSNLGQTLLLIFGVLAGLSGGLMIVFWNGVPKPAPRAAADEDSAPSASGQTQDTSPAVDADALRARQEKLIDAHIVYVGRWLAHAKSRQALETQAIALFARMKEFMDFIRRAADVQELSTRVDDARKLQSEGLEMKAKLDDLRQRCRNALEAATANARQLDEAANLLSLTPPLHEEAGIAKCRARRMEVLNGQVHQIEDLRTIDSAIDDIESAAASVSTRLTYLLVRFKQPKAGANQAEAERQIRDEAKKEAAECDVALAKLIKRAQDMDKRYAQLQAELTKSRVELQQLNTELRSAISANATAPRDRTAPSAPSTTPSPR